MSEQDPLALYDPDEIWGACHDCGQIITYGEATRGDECGLYPKIYIDGTHLIRRCGQCADVETEVGS